MRNSINFKKIIVDIRSFTHKHLHHIIFAIFVLFVGVGLISKSYAQSSGSTYFVACWDSHRKLLYDVSYGSSTPTSPTCRSGDDVVDWASGDILSVLSGTGLTGGGNSGNLELSILTSYRLPQSCSNGQIPSWNATSSQWDCTNGPTYSAGAGLSLNSNEFSISDSGVTTSKIADNAVTGTKIANVTRIVTAVQNYVLLASSGTTKLTYQFAIPYDYAGGDLTVREWYYVHDNTGTAVMSRYRWKAASNGTVSSVESNVSHNFTPSALGDAVRTWTISSSTVNAGDVFDVYVQRSGDDASDTLGRLEPRAIAIEYQAEQ